MSEAKPSGQVRPETELPNRSGGLAALRSITFTRLKYLSFTHSAIYLSLLAVWISGGPEDLKMVLGWCHGIGWIVMSLLCIAAVRMRVIPLWLAVMVAVIGGVGPFAGSVGFVVHERRAAPAGGPQERGMV